MKKSALLLIPALALIAAAPAQAQTTVTSGYVQSVQPGTVTLNGGGLLAVNDTTFTVSNNIVLGTNGGLFRAYASVAGGAFGFGAKGDGRLVINGPVTGTGGVSFQDGGQMQFNASNSYTGNTTFDGASGGASVNIGNVNAFSGSTVVLSGYQSLNFSVAGTNTYNFGGLSGSQNQGLGANTLSVGANNQNNTYSGALSGTGGFVKAGSGTQTLSGANTFTGGTVINNGTLALGSANRLADSGAVTVNAGAFNLGGFSETVGAVTLAGGIITNGTLTGSSYDLRSGSISAMLAGNAGITKTTADTVVLTGSNTYKGTTTISAGTLQVGNGGTTGSLGSGTITSSGTLAFNRSDSITITNKITGTGSLIQVGTGTTTLSANNQYTGTTTVSAGTLNIGDAATGSLFIDNGGGGGHTSSLLVNGGTLNNRSAQIGGVSNSGLVTVSSGSWNNNWTLNVGYYGSGSLSISGGTVTSYGSWIGSETGSTGSASVSSGSLINRSFLIVGGSTFGGTGSGTISVVDSGLVSVGDGSGVVTLGQAIASSGTLNLGNGGSSIGTLLASEVKGGSGTATVNVNSTGTANLGQNFTGSLEFNQIGTGTTVLTGTNSYTGTTTISDGTLQVGNGGTQGTLGSESIVNNATLAFDRSNEITVSNQISGYGSLAQNGTGTTTLGAANTYTGTTKVSEGTLALGANGSFASASSAQIASGATLDLAAKSQTLTDAKVNGNIAGSGTMTVTGTLSGSGTINADTVVTGIHSPGNSPGIQSFNGNLTYQSGAGILLEFADNTTVNSPVAYDQILVGKDLNFSGLTSLNISFGETGSAVDWNNAFWQTSQSWTLYSVSGLTTGFDNLTLNSSNWSDASGDIFGDVLSGGTFSLAQNGNNVVLNYAIPEPSTYALMGLGALALVIAYRRKRA